MSGRRGRWRRVRDIFWLLVAITTVSMLVTSRLADSLVWLRSRSITRLFEIPIRLLSQEATEYPTGDIISPNSRTTDTVQDLIRKGRQENQVDFAVPTAVGNNSILTSGGVVILQHVDWTPSHAAERASHWQNPGFRDTNYDHSRFKNVDNTFGLQAVDLDRREKRNELKLIRAENQTTDPRGNVSSMKTILAAQYAKHKFPTDALHEAIYEGAFPASPNVSNLLSLYDKISQVESAYQSTGGVLVRGPLTSLKHHLPLIESAFHKLKVKVAYETTDDTWPGIAMDSETGSDNWSILMCLNTTSQGHNCVISAKPSPRWKINVIPQLTSVIMSPKLMCQTNDEKTDGDSRGQWYGGKLSCVKTHLGKVMEKEACGFRNRWWIVSETESGVVGKFVPCDGGSSLEENQRMDDKILVPLPKNLLPLDRSASLVWQVEILVTSLLPARVYIHPHGLVWEGLHNFTQRKHQRNALLQDLWQMISEWANESTATMTLTKLQTALMKVVRIAEKYIVITGGMKK